MFKLSDLLSKMTFKVQKPPPEPVFRRIIFKCKDTRLAEEYDDLKTTNKPLFDLLTDLNDYTNKKFGKGIVLTMIFRTTAEQESIYGKTARYRKRPFSSPHQWWQATDIRSYTFTKEEINQVCDYLNKKYNDSNYYKWTAKCHEVGKHGWHFHIQYYRSKK